MNKVILIILIFAIGLCGCKPIMEFDNLKFIVQYEKNNFHVLKGVKADGDSITMKVWQLKDLACIIEGAPIQSQPRKLKGWYQLDEYEPKYPLIGYWGSKLGTKLFVVSNPSDSIDLNTCELKDYEEVFFNEFSSSNLNILEWKRSADSISRSLVLWSEKKPSFQSNAILNIIEDEISIAVLNLTEISKQSGILHLESIEKAEILSKSQHKGHIHLIIRLNESLFRESYEYIAYLQLDDILQIEDFKIGNTMNSWNGEGDHIVDYDINQPELGIKVTKK